MTKVSEVMTSNVAAVTPDDSLRRAAQMMDGLNVGILPVCSGRRLVGVITDRDVTVRATSAGQGPDDTRVAAAMTTEIQYCYEDDEISDAEQVMSELQIRRLPVLDAEQNLVGVVTMGDLATRGIASVEATLRKVSEPSKPDR